MTRLHIVYVLRSLPMLLAFICVGVHADQRVTSGTGSLTASVSLNFNITVGKYVMLRVGNPDASISDVNFSVGLGPAFTAGTNSQTYSGTAFPTLVVGASTTNPAAAGAALPVAAFSNVSGTLLSCNLGGLSGATALATGATAAGVPGRNDITVTSTSGSGNVQHPGGNLGACNGSTTTPIPMATVLSGTFTYGTAFAASALASGIYGNVVTYTVTTP